MNNKISTFILICFLTLIFSCSSSGKKSWQKILSKGDIFTCLNDLSVVDDSHAMAVGCVGKIVEVSNNQIRVLPSHTDKNLRQIVSCDENRTHYAFGTGSHYLYTRTIHNLWGDTKEQDYGIKPDDRESVLLKITGENVEPQSLPENFHDLDALAVSHDCSVLAVAGHLAGEKYDALFLRQNDIWKRLPSPPEDYFFTRNSALTFANDVLLVAAGSALFEYSFAKDSWQTLLSHRQDVSGQTAQHTLTGMDLSKKYFGPDHDLFLSIASPLGLGGIPYKVTLVHFQNQQLQIGTFDAKCLDDSIDSGTLQSNAFFPYSGLYVFSLRTQGSEYYLLNPKSFGPHTGCVALPRLNNNATATQASPNYLWTTTTAGEIYKLPIDWKTSAQFLEH